MKRKTLAVVFHHKTVNPVVLKDGTVSYDTVPIPINEWEIRTEVCQSPYDRLNDAIDTAEGIVSAHDSTLKPYSRGYDEGYLAGLNHAMRILNKKET